MWGYFSLSLACILGEKNKKIKLTQFRWARMKAPKSWGPWQLNLNSRVQGLWNSQGDSSPAAFSTPPAVRRPSPRAQKCQKCPKAGHSAFGSGSHSDLLLPDKQPHPSKLAHSPSEPSRCPLPTPCPAPRHPEADPFSPSLPSQPPCSHSRDLNFFWVLLPSIWIKKSFQELKMQLPGSWWWWCPALGSSFGTFLWPHSPFLALSGFSWSHMWTMYPVCTGTFKMWFTSLKLFPWGAEQGRSGWRCLWELTGGCWRHCSLWEGIINQHQSCLSWQEHQQSILTSRNDIFWG